MLNQQSATQIDPFVGVCQVDSTDGEVRMTSRRSAIAASVSLATTEWLARRKALSPELRHRRHHLGRFGRDVGIQNSRQQMSPRRIVRRRSDKRKERP